MRYDIYRINLHCKGLCGGLGSFTKEFNHKRREKYGSFCIKASGGSESLLDTASKGNVQVASRYSERDLRKNVYRQIQCKNYYNCKHAYQVILSNRKNCRILQIFRLFICGDIV